MTVPFDLPSDHEWEDSGGLRGCGGTAIFRVSRRSDGASVLLHELDLATEARIDGATFTPQVPDFSVPFVSNFLGTTVFSKRSLLVEAIPPSVPLVDAWRTILQHSPSKACGMLRHAIVQFNSLFQQLADQNERHGAVCAANAFLTTQGTYGLLAARLEVGEREVLLRPLEFVSPATHQTPDLLIPTDHPETVALVLLDLLTVEADLAALPVQDRSELHRLCEPYITTLVRATQ